MHLYAGWLSEYATVRLNVSMMRSMLLQPYTSLHLKADVLPPPWPSADSPVVLVDHREAKSLCSWVPQS